MLLLSLLLPLPASSIQQASYTDAQANAGRSAYEAECATCHLDELQGSGTAPPTGGVELPERLGKPARVPGTAVHPLFHAPWGRGVAE